MMSLILQSFIKFDYLPMLFEEQASILPYFPIPNKYRKQPNRFGNEL